MHTISESNQPATLLARTAKKAAVKLWVKPYQNLRSTRATELAREFAQHIVVAWIGNTPAVAAKHYLQVTEFDFERALGFQNTVVHITVVHIVEQQVPEGRGNTGNAAEKPTAKNPNPPTILDNSSPIGGPSVPPLGLEPRTY